MALFSADDITYPPLDVRKPVADGVWIVDSGPLRVFGLLGLPIRMTALQLSSGDMLMHSPTRFDARLKAEIEAHGPIRHLVAPNIAHWSFLAEWQGQGPDAVTWAAPGLPERANVKASDVRLDRDLPAESPPEWAQDLEQAVIPGAAGFREGTFFHRPSRTLVLTDLVVTWRPASCRYTRAPSPGRPACSRPTERRPLIYASSLSAAPLQRARPRAGWGRSTPSGSSSRTDAGSTATAPRSCDAHSAGFCADRARWLRFRRGGSRLALTEGSKRL